MDTNYIGKSINSNYIHAGQTLTGKIVFKESEFYFLANSVNGNMRMNNTDYGDVESVDFKNTFGIFRNGIIIKTRFNDEYFYVVRDRNNIRNFIITMSREV